MMKSFASISLFYEVQLVDLHYQSIYSSLAMFFKVFVYSFCSPQLKLSLIPLPIETVSRPCKQLQTSATLLKKILLHSCFPVNFVKFLGPPFLQNTYGLPLLYQQKPHKKKVWNFDVKIGEKVGNFSTISNRWKWYRSCQQRCSVRKSFLRNFAKFHSKTPVPESIF